MSIWWDSRSSNSKNNISIIIIINLHAVEQVSLISEVFSMHKHSLFVFHEQLELHQNDPSQLFSFVQNHLR